MAVGQPFVNERPLRHPGRKQRLTVTRPQSQSTSSHDGGDNTKTEPQGSKETNEASA